MKAPYKHLPKLYSLGNFILTQEQTWYFNDILTYQGEDIRRITEWIKRKSLVGAATDLLWKAERQRLGACLKTMAWQSIE